MSRRATPNQASKSPNRRAGGDRGESASANGDAGARRAVTPPKGRPTPRRNAQKAVIQEGRARSGRLEWAVLAIVVVAVIAAMIVFGDWGGSGNAPIGGHGN